MKKKIIALTVAAVLLMMAVVGGTYAYLKDTDGAKNVMVTGNVKIVQNETDRNGATFQQDQKLVPAVYNGTLSYDGESALYGKIFDETVDGEIDKFVTVTNTGTEAAYIRTILLFEDDEADKVGEKLHTLNDKSDGQEMVWLLDDQGKEIFVTIGGEKFAVAVCTYNTALAAGATSAPSLKQIFLDPSVDNEWFTLVNGKYDIYAFSQAVQSAGFEDEGATVALNAAFGEVTADNVTAWLTSLGLIG